MNEMLAVWKEVKANQVHILHLISGIAVPVCSDDRVCYSPVQRNNVKKE